MSTLIRVQPDTEWTEAPMNIGFEVPTEQIWPLRTPNATQEEIGAAMVVVSGYASAAIKLCETKSKVLGWEINYSKPPGTPQRDRIQEDIEELEVRRIEGKLLAPVSKMTLRGMENWNISVWAKRKMRLMPKYPDQKGPADGYEDWDALPPDYREHGVQPVFEEQGN